MPREKSSRSKSQTLSLRLNPKTRFVLEFISKVQRRSITTIVEDAIKQAGDELSVGEGSTYGPRDWSDYWDVSEGVRTMLMLADQARLPSSYEDDELRDFIEQHIEFFSAKNDLGRPDRTNVEVLWPHIDTFLDRWRDLKRTDPYQVGHDLCLVLENASIKPPKWPRETKEPPPPQSDSSGGQSYELDDDIPF